MRELRNRRKQSGTLVVIGTLLGGTLWSMCVQCAMGATSAAAAVGGATGIRAWLGAKGFAWMTPGRMRVTTIALLAMGVIGASVGVSGA